MYVFNKEKKRLEPTSTTCQYCGKARATHMSDCYFASLYKENDRTNIVVYRSVKYSKVPVGITRCKDCRNIHQQAGNRATLIAAGITVAVVAIPVTIWGAGGILSLIGAPFIGIGALVYFESKLVRRKGIYTKSDGARESEAVKDLLTSGWSFDIPHA